MSYAVAVAVWGVFLGVYLTAVVVGAGLILAVRVPVFRSSGTVRLQADGNPHTVREQFTDICPPILALQWGVADEVAPTESGADYEFSYLFGLRSATMNVDVQSDSVSEQTDRVELTVSVEDNPWGTYTATIEGTDTGSIVDVEYTSDRRFGLRRLPQQLIGERYYDSVLDAQGFTVAERERTIGL